jgi:hypothetical protein
LGTAVVVSRAETLGGGPRVCCTHTSRPVESGISSKLKPVDVSYQMSPRFAAVGGFAPW